MHSIKHLSKHHSEKHMFRLPNIKCCVGVHFSTFNWNVKRSVGVCSLHHHLEQSCLDRTYQIFGCFTRRLFETGVSGTTDAAAASASVTSSWIPLVRELVDRDGAELAAVVGGLLMCAGRVEPELLEGMGMAKELRAAGANGVADSFDATCENKEMCGHRSDGSKDCAWSQACCSNSCTAPSSPPYFLNERLAKCFP